MIHGTPNMFYIWGACSSDGEHITIFELNEYVSLRLWGLAEAVHYRWEYKTCLILSVRTAESIDLDCVLIIKHFSCLGSSCSFLQHPITVYQYKCYCLILNWFLRIYHHTVQSIYIPALHSEYTNTSLISEDSSVYQ